MVPRGSRVDKLVLVYHVPDHTCLSFVKLHEGNKAAPEPDANGAMPSGSSQMAPDPRGPKAIPASIPLTR